MEKYACFVPLVLGATVVIRLWFVPALEVSLFFFTYDWIILQYCGIKTILVKSRHTCFITISSSYVVQAVSYVYKVWFLVTYIMKIQVILDVMPFWPVNTVKHCEDISRKIRQLIWLTKQENILKA